MQYQYFVSSRWRNKEKVHELVEKLREKGKSVYNFVENKKYNPMMEGKPEAVMQEYEAIPNWREDAMVRAMFEQDMEGLKNSEELILLLPAGKSCHLEAGIAYGMGKKCTLIGEQREAESLYLIFSEAYVTVDDFINSL